MGSRRKTKLSPNSWPLSKVAGQWIAGVRVMVPAESRSVIRLPTKNILHQNFGHLPPPPHTPPHRKKCKHYHKRSLRGPQPSLRGCTYPALPRTPRPARSDLAGRPSVWPEAGRAQAGPVVMQVPTDTPTLPLPAQGFWGALPTPAWDTKPERWAEGCPTGSGCREGLE